MQNRVRRALVSVYDKEGIVDFCRFLASHDVEILSSDGTARVLDENGIATTRVADYTGFPEMLDGRVKTLHPRIHGGILASRSNDEHMKDLERNEIKPIDLVAVNLYPFEDTATTPGIGPAEVVEMIDIGGPTMVRAAAKNFAHVTVVVDPGDYSEVQAALEQNGGPALDLRRRLAVKAFRHTSHYDRVVHSYLARSDAAGEVESEASPFGENLQLEFSRIQGLRYGENPHQRAAFYRDGLWAGPSVAGSRQLQGKELSFNNILDLDAALALAVELHAGCCVIIKHGNPCGVGLGSEPRAAFDRALECDPTSAFGGVIAFNTKLDARVAEAISQSFFEAVIAPEMDVEARDLLAKKKKLRLLESGEAAAGEHNGFDLRRVRGGVLVQDWDRSDETVREATVVTQRGPTESEWKALEFSWTVAKHVKSNAIVYARPDRTVGIGAGQMSRVDSARFGAQKAQTPLEGTVMASDAFFPFRDGIDAAAEQGISAVVQPGGSIRDKEVVAAANEHGMAMVLTGKRHFRL